MATPSTVALIVAAGQGSRAGGPVPKQFAHVAGRPMIAHSYESLALHPAIDAAVVVVAPGQEEALEAALGRVPHVTGGATRRESVRRGLEALAAEDGVERVLIHDAARPFLPPRVVDRLLAALRDHVGAVPGLPVADTLARASKLLGDTVPREGVVRVQTPQAFRFAEILAAHRAWPESDEATDDAQIARAAGHGVALIPGDVALEKVTHPADFAAADARHGPAMEVRTATGYDVHRYADGREMWLGGVKLPHARGLAGHSDADVALHAITDALLGTIGAGDIGMHFPPSDPQWAGAPSAQFLDHAAGLVRARGGRIDFVDLTLVCEAPKIGPYREAIRARIAEILRLDNTRVSVKATTTERLGFTGRGEGMAAHAVATVRVPAA